MPFLAAALTAAFLFAGSALASCASQPMGEVPHWSAEECGEPCVVRLSLGGLIGDYEAAAIKIEREGRHLAILGDCYSACTIAADMLRKTGHVCLGPHAVLYIHQSYVCDGLTVRRELVSYSPGMMNWIERHGGEPTNGFLPMTARQAGSLFPSCR